MEEWKIPIVNLVRIKQQISENDVQDMYPLHLPEIAASETEIINVELKLGFQLDTYYRCFLKYANGWKAFYQTVDLFGTKELVDSSIMSYAEVLLDSIDESVMSCTGFKKEEVMPIATTMEDKDLFVITTPYSPKPGAIIWFAGEEIDRFENFDEYFLSMIEYNKLTLGRMLKKRQ